MLIPLPLQVESKPRRRRRGVLTMVLLLGACQSPPSSPPVPPGSPVAVASRTPRVIDGDGSWCWFQTERALAIDGKLLIGSIAAGRDDPSRRGDTEMLVHDWRSQRTTRIEFHDRLQRDDHNVPGLVRLSDGRVLALYSMHGNDAVTRMRFGTPPFDADHWTPERNLPRDAVGSDPVTYHNVFRVGSGPEGDLLLDFYRGPGWDPGAVRSPDGGQHWFAAGKLLSGPGRPYVRYATDGHGRIHFICTEQHPRDAENSVWHGFLEDGRIHRSDGKEIGSLAAGGVAPEQLTQIFAGAADRVAWVQDLRVDAAGYPVAVFSVQRDGAGLPPGQGGMDHRYHYARFDGTQWHQQEIAYGGRRLYAGEDDYTGGIVLDPFDPNRVYYSTDAEPRTGAPLLSATDGLRHHEIWTAQRKADGWSHLALTQDSSTENLRPQRPAGDPQPAVLLWLRGSYTTYQDFAQEVVMLDLDGLLTAN